jgi:tetratricopeptide (TPR) repeat protein
MMHESRKYKACLTKIKEAKLVALADPVSSQPHPERQSRLLWIKGSCYRGLNKFEKAKRYLQQCLELDSSVKAERFTMAYSHLDLAEICLEEGMLDEALAHLKKAKAYKEYDWANVINLRITSAEQRTQTRRKSAASSSSTHSAK